MAEPKACKILLVSIDSWRYDATSRTNSLINTPKFDLLTRGYNLAERFFVTAPATRPSHSSLFTGLYPFEHGLYGQTYLRTFAGIDHLFQLFTRAGFRAQGYSERSDVFRFLDFEPFIKPFDENVRQQHLGALEPLLHNLIEADEVPQFKFLHFWYTHGGYGLGGIPKGPDLRGLVAAGRVREALRYYCAAITHVLEFVLVEVLKRVDPAEWGVFIFGDHGEGFCDEVMAHGDRLNEKVIHVPLFAHFPQGISFPSGPVSMVDLFPTLVDWAGLQADYRGFGRSLLQPGTFAADRLVLSELDTTYGTGFLGAGHLQTPHKRVTSRTSIDGAELEQQGLLREWSLCDGEHFYRETESTGQNVLREVMGGAELSNRNAVYYRSRYADLRQATSYANLEERDVSVSEAEVLEERLRDLGYIE